MIRYLIIGLLLALVFILAYTVNRLDRQLKQSQGQCNQMHADYLALDKGMDEQRESYEQDYLTHVDEINAKTLHIYMLEATIAEDDAIIRRLYSFTERHQQFCPSQYMDVVREDDQEFLKELHEELFPPEDGEVEDDIDRFEADDEDDGEVSPSGG